MNPKIFNFRMPVQTWHELNILSKSLLRTKSSLIRWLIHKEFKRLGLTSLEKSIELEEAAGNAFSLDCQ
ncbi:MAG: hypothetical protein GX142_01330 [Chloroflexi bacterium]|nr:hypothetical protein [Chloroflexota bacterium]